MTRRHEWHGLTGTRIQNIWQQMIRRCYSPRSSAYRKYGACGITVCPEWRKSLRTFHRDMGDPPSPQHTLDRYPDKHGNYEPGNCRWATRKQQARNSRINRNLTLNGKTYSVAEWAEKLGMPVNTIYSRWRLGLNPKEILDPRPRHSFKGGKWLDGKRIPKKAERHGYRHSRKHGGTLWT